MTIQQEVIKPVTSAYIELFEFDFSNIPEIATTRLYLTPSSQGSSITWKGQTYLPWAIQIEGIDSSSDGAPARPTLSVGNLDVSKLIGSMAFIYSDIIGAKIVYTRTFETFLTGTNSLPPMTYTVGRKVSHNQSIISFELRSPLDKERAYFPNRQMLKKDFPGLGLSKHVGRSQ